MFTGGGDDLDEQELLELTHELSALGGDAARVGQCEVYCYLYPGATTGPSHVSIEGGRTVVWRDGSSGDCNGKRHPSRTAAEDSLSCSVTAAYEGCWVPGKGLRGVSLTEAVSTSAAAWVLAGYNNTVVALGAPSTTQARLLFD
eukprot:RCo004234